MSAPFYNHLKGRTFTRLDSSFVELFVKTTCEDCGAPVSLNSIIIKEPNDNHLLSLSIPREVKPETGFRLGPHEPARCRQCHQAWLDPYKSLRRA